MHDMLTLALRMRVRRAALLATVALSLYISLPMGNSLAHDSPCGLNWRWLPPWRSGHWAARHDVTRIVHNGMYLQTYTYDYRA